MGKQGRGRRLTDRERLEIVEIARRNPRVTHVELAASYHVNESTIRKWRREDNASRIRARHDSGGRDNLRRGQTARSEHFDAQLFAWICAERARGVQLPPIKIREKARALAASYGQMEGFKASSGWYYRYCRRFDLPCPSTPALQSEKVEHSDERSSSSTEGTTTKMEEELLLDLEAAVDAVCNENRASSTLSDTTTAEQPKIEPCCATTLLDSTHASVSETPQLGTAFANAPTLQVPQASTVSRQKAIAHFLHHHTDLLSRECRLHFIQHLADAPEEMAAFALMDNAARVSYTKRFAAKHRVGTEWCEKVKL